VPSSVVEVFDERFVSDLELVVQGMLGRHEVAGFLYPKHLARAMAWIASIGNAVILGRGANFLLPNALNVRMDASLDRRIENMFTYEDIDREAAEIKLLKSDRERERFIRKIFGKEKVRLGHYDICLWMNKFTATEAAQIVETAYRVRFKTD
jgi:cytidylate kinase